MNPGDLFEVCVEQIALYDKPIKLPSHVNAMLKVMDRHRIALLETGDSVVVAGDVVPSVGFMGDQLVYVITRVGSGWIPAGAVKRIDD